MDNNESAPKDGTDDLEKGAGALTLFVPPVASHAKAAAPAADRARRLPDRLPIYAAAVCLALGTGGVLGNRFLPETGEKAADATANVEATKIERALPWKKEVAENAARDGAKLREDLRALRGELAALRANNEQLRQSEGQRQAQELRAMRATLEAQKSETASLKADMTARFDRADRDASQRTDKTVERVDRLERRLADPVATGTTSKAPEPAKAAATEPPKPEKQPVRGFVLRDVARGVALIETRRGLMEVMAGDMIPGAGRVELIEKHAGRWRVVTSTGVIDDQID